MSLTPNKPINRFRHVVKTYKDSASPIVPFAVAEIALWLTGQDASAGRFRSDWRDAVADAYVASFARPYTRDPEAPYAGFSGVTAPSATVARERLDDPEGKWFFRHRTPRRVEDRDWPRRGTAWENLDWWMSTELPEQHPLDFVIPWAARELGRLAKEVRKGRATDVDWDSATLSLQRSSTAIGMWAQGNKVDLSKVTLAEALEAIRDYEVDTGEPVPQGKVVYRWDDGWTIQQLGPGELEAEGEVMQHCVGDYCEAVEEGETQIFSLRDPHGRPHATIEYLESINRFAQVQGKQNQPPKPEYQKRVDEWTKAKGVAPANELSADETDAVREVGYRIGAEEWDDATEGPEEFNIIGAQEAPAIDVDAWEVAQAAFPHIDPRLWEEADLEDTIAQEALDAANERWTEIYDGQMEALDAIIDDAADRVDVLVGAGQEPDVADIVREAFEQSSEIGTWGFYDWEYVMDAVKQRTGIAANPGRTGHKLWPRKEADKILAAFGRSYDGIDEQQFRRGIVVELEHTDNPVIAAKIALDHLDEMRDYYTRLDAMEAAAER